LFGMMVLYMKEVSKKDYFLVKVVWQTKTKSILIKGSLSMDKSMAKVFKKQENKNIMVEYIFILG
jgi:hypothetical protein